MADQHSTALGIQKDAADKCSHAKSPPIYPARARSWTPRPDGMAIVWMDFLPDQLAGHRHMSHWSGGDLPNLASATACQRRSRRDSWTLPRMNERNIDTPFRFLPPIPRGTSATSSSPREHRPLKAESAGSSPLRPTSLEKVKTLHSKDTMATENSATRGQL